MREIANRRKIEATVAQNQTKMSQLEQDVKKCIENKCDVYSSTYGSIENKLNGLEKIVSKTINELISSNRHKLEYLEKQISKSSESGYNNTLVDALGKKLNRMDTKLNDRLSKIENTYKRFEEQQQLIKFALDREPLNFVKK